jgi:hypothetical protein
MVSGDKETAFLSDPRSSFHIPHFQFLTPHSRFPFLLSSTRAIFHHRRFERMIL